MEKSHYEDRNKANQMFNSKSKEVKRGQAIVPIKFFSGGAYEDMKGSALVRVYQGFFSNSQIVNHGNTGCGIFKRGV